MEDKDALVEEVSMSKDELINRLIATGVNGMTGSYSQEDKDMYQGFLNLPMKEVAQLWTFLNERVQIALIRSHHEDFMSWIRSLTDE